MEIAFDPAKDVVNRRERGIPLAYFTELDWSSAKIVLDTRQDYGEDRLIAYVKAPNGRLMVAVYTMRGAVFRVISLRKANRREVQTYD